MAKINEDFWGFLGFWNYSKVAILNPLSVPKPNTINFTSNANDKKLEFIEYIKNLTDIKNKIYIQMLTKFLDQYYPTSNLKISKEKVSFNIFIFDF